ncbi:hypothetical protein [Brunnivagina elsteri]|uniref:Uncharacterized protein n=1 Tax=Brunnivagina elsteri CCALA 953 TaxID=987040 RepID=A0A2A2TIY3_9CYAN|nr:hypothetical protein [Calothrix elsteri]PAX53891.1 hypothetical protein CK510_13070 [Calothrix elsteri CCALA 953]
MLTQETGFLPHAKAQISTKEPETGFLCQRKNPSQPTKMFLLFIFRAVRNRVSSFSESIQYFP